MPSDGTAVEKLCGDLLRGLRALPVAILGVGREACLYGIHTSAIGEFEAWGRRLRDPRIGSGTTGRRVSGALCFVIMGEDGRFSYETRKRKCRD